MLRSRTLRPGRFHTSPSSVPAAYFSSAGATRRTSSRILVWSACAEAEANMDSVASVAARNFILVSCLSLGLLQSRKRELRRSQRAFHPVQRVDKILLRLPLVARKAAIEVFVGVHRLVGVERLEFPFAVALRGRVVGAPARALFHDHVSEKLSVPVVDQRNHGAARDQ